MSPIERFKSRHRSYLVEFYKVGFGGSVRVAGKVWTAWPWCRWVRVWVYLA